MSVGWGYRGDYGHEAGAMIPGALLGLSVALASCRTDWLDRASLLGFLGAIGWAFGGQMSYGLVVGYTSANDLTNVTFGYAAIFVVGALWGGIGCGILALGLTERRSFLERFAAPLVLLYATWWILHLTGVTPRVLSRWPIGDSDWFEATTALLVAVIAYALFPRSRAACGLLALLAAGWWAGYALLVLVLGLRLNPPRSENWAGCVGILTALAGWHAVRRNTLALGLMLVGLIAGGVGFTLGDFANMLSRAKWGPIGASETLRALNGWKWMEQGFGLVMGLVIGFAIGRIASRPQEPVVDDEPNGPWRTLAPAFLLVPMLLENFRKNVIRWSDRGHIREPLFGIEPGYGILLAAILVASAVIFAIIRARQGRLAMAPSSALGRAQLLFFCLLYAPALATLIQVLPGLDRKGSFFVHLSFWVTAGLASWVVLTLPSDPFDVASRNPSAPVDTLKWLAAGVIALVILAPLLVVTLAKATLASHAAPLPNARFRFEQKVPQPAPLRAESSDA
jgi:hypothetical protein